MSATLAPYGLRPILNNNAQGGVPSAYRNPFASTAYATALYQGTPVIMATTGIITIWASAAMLGVFAGCEYVDAQGRRVYSKYWPASAATSDDTTIAYVWDHPDTMFEIQATGSLAISSRGDQADFSATSGYTLGAGSSTTGLSSAGLSTTLAGAGSQKLLRIMDIAPYTDNAWADTYTQVRVKIANHQFVYPQTAI